MKWDWKKFLIAAGIRAVRTFAQTFVGFIAVGAALEEIQWLRALSVSGAAAVLSILTSLATGLPEVDKKPEPEKADEEEGSKGSMDNKCKNCGDNQGENCVPFFDVQNTMMHYNWANRRMLIALVCICITMICVVIVFATNQTKREQMWQETIKSMYSSTVTGVDDEQHDADH